MLIRIEIGIIWFSPWQAVPIALDAVKEFDGRSILGSPATLRVNSCYSGQLRLKQHQVILQGSLNL